jgi:serine/threonine-protein kinase RsbW
VKKTKTSARKDELTFDLICISDPKEITKVEPFLKSVNRAAQLDDGTFYRLLVALTEAVNNAIMHGNRSDRSKEVCISCILSPAKLLIRVEDEGRGFNPENVPNPLDEANLLKESGRGIFLMRSMMDKVKYHTNKKGTVVEMTVNLKRLQ